MLSSTDLFNNPNFNNFQQEIILQVPVPILVVEGPEFIISISNEKNLELWQRTKEEVLGKPLFDVFPEAQAQPFHDYLTEVYQTGIGTKRNEEKVEIYRNGVLDTAWFDINFEPTKNDKGEVTAIMIILVEITAQVLARKKIENSEKELKLMADAMPNLVWMADDEGNINFYNKRIYDYCGLNENIDKNSLWQTIVHPDDVSKTKKTWQIALRRRTPYTIQHRIKMKNGLFRWFLSRALCEEDVDNNTYKWFGSSTEIDEQKNTELKIKETEKFNRTILESNPDCLTVIDKAGQIQYMNYNGQCLLEIDDFKQVKNKIWGELWGIENQNLVENATQQVLLGETVKFIIEAATAKGTSKWWDIMVLPIYTPDGEVKEIMSVSRDISIQKSAEEKIIKARELFETTLQNVPSAIYHLDKNGKILYLNELAAKQMGFSSIQEVLAIDNVYELRNRLDETFTLFDEKGKVLAADESCTSISLKTEKPAEVIVKFVSKKDESSFWLLTKSVPLHNEKGELTDIFTSCTDVTPQKQSEEALRLSESRYRRIFEHTPLPIWEEDFSEIKNLIDHLVEQGITDFAAYFATRREELCEYIDTVKIKDVNEASLKMYGCTKEELLVGLRQFYVEDTLSGFIKIFQVIAKGGGRFETESIVKNKAGQLLNLMIFIDFPTNKQDYSSVQVIRFDITERKKADESLQYRKALLEAQNEAIIDAILIVDEEGNMLSFNKKFAKIWQMPDEITINKDDNEALEFAMNSVMDPEEFIKRVRYCYAHPEVKAHDEIYLKDGRIFDRYGNAVIGENGNYYGWAWYFRDITEQRQREIIIKESEEKLRLLTETIPQMVWMSDAVGNPEYLSSQWEKYAGKMLMSDYWKTICHPDDFNNSIEEWQKSLSTGKKYKSEARLINKKGEYCWHVSVGVPLKDDTGNIIKWIGSVTDINEQKLNEQKKDEFISIASHEMKTPLTSAKAYLQLLELSLDENNPNFIYAKKASESTERLNKLISELLDSSRIQHGKLNYHNSTFNFEEMIDNTIENVQYSSTTHKIIRLGSISKHYWGDRDRLQQVVINLLTNAIKYSPKAQEVIIKIEEQNKQLMVSVIDKGIGMSEKHLERVFDRYYRVEEHAIQFQGLGIGLYISYDIVKRHQGNMWVESYPEKGSTFHFTLPFIRHETRE